MRIELRPAREDDQSTLRRLVRQARLNPFGVTWPNFVIAETTEGRIVGIAQLKPHRATTELASVVVVPELRKRGIGRMLIEYCVARFAAEHPGESLWLMCEAHNAPLYRKFGFQTVRDTDQMPPYFRRLQRLANLIAWLTRREVGLHIMVR